MLVRGIIMHNILVLFISCFIATAAFASSELKELEARFKQMDFVAEMHRLQPQNKAPNSLPRVSGRILFLSFSMPKAMLRDYISQGEAQGAHVVFKGFKDDSFKATIAYAAEIFADEEEGIPGGFDIDPELFAAYGVTAVPAFVEGRDIVRGTVTASYAYNYLQQRRQP
jgi:type-F conjugative transfer system pilin assembly protein TrbC